MAERSWVQITAGAAWEFPSPGSTICSAPVLPHVAGKRSWSFYQKCRWQVTGKHAYTLHMWLCMKWHGCMAKAAAVLCGTSHAFAVSTPLQWIFFSDAPQKVIHPCRIACKHSESAREQKIVLYKAIITINQLPQCCWNQQVSRHMLISRHLLCLHTSQKFTDIKNPWVGSNVWFPLFQTLSSHFSTQDQALISHVAQKRTDQMTIHLQLTDNGSYHNWLTISSAASDKVCCLVWRSTPHHVAILYVTVP